MAVLYQFSGGSYTTAISIGFFRGYCDMPHVLRFRRFTNTAASPDYSFDLDPASWAPQVVTATNGEVFSTGVFYDPVDARNYGQPQTPNLSIGATYHYELCAENTAGSGCLSGNITIPAPPPDPPTQVSICWLPDGHPCANLDTVQSAGQFIKVVGARPQLPASLTHVNGPVTAGGGVNWLTPSGVSLRGGTPSNFILTGYRIEWSPADNRTKRIDVERYDASAAGDHWVQAARVAATARFADLTSAPFGNLYRVCFRGEAYDNPAFPLNGPLSGQLANTCSPPISVPLKMIKSSIGFKPPTGAFQPTK
jgi:hypothetical protein